VSIHVGLLGEVLYEFKKQTGDNQESTSEQKRGRKDIKKASNQQLREATLGTTRGSERDREKKGQGSAEASIRAKLHIL
jgi:hypothetical protein